MKFARCSSGPHPLPPGLVGVLLTLKSSAGPAAMADIYNAGVLNRLSAKQMHGATHGVMLLTLLTVRVTPGNAINKTHE